MMILTAVLKIVPVLLAVSALRYLQQKAHQYRADNELGNGFFAALKDNGYKARIAAMLAVLCASALYVMYLKTL